LRFFFPFRWGPAVVVVPEPEPEPPLWTNLTKGSANWHAQSPTLRRFEHIYPEADTGPGFVKVTDVVD
jgi:hypothetical protein